MEAFQCSKVYLAVLQQISWLKQSLLLDQTNCCETLGDAAKIQLTLEYVARCSRKRRLPKINDSVIASFMRNNASVPISTEYLIAQGIRTLPISYFTNMTWESWDMFYRDYQDTDGYVSFSNVGCDFTENWALVYAVNMSGPTVGGGYFYFLHQENLSWRVAGHFGVVDY